MKADCKQLYGSEYPAAVQMKGIRLPLETEERFSRHYYSAEKKIGTSVSRFLDGSASMTIAELEMEWDSWNGGERWEFCHACSEISDEPEFPAMLRFMVDHASPNDWCHIAHLVADVLPAEEAFNILVRALSATDARGATSIVQAIAMTKHPEASAALYMQMETVWSDEAIWDGSKPINWLAECATACIVYLIELGASPAEFETGVRQLSKHPCQGSRKPRRMLKMLCKHYDWLV